MKFLEQVKTMFTNKEDVSSFKGSHIFHNFVYMNDNLMKADKKGSIIWMVSFPHESLCEFIQIAENFKGYKAYIFDKEVVVLLHLDIPTIANIVEMCRYTNNPFVYALKEDCVINIPKDYMKLTDMDYTNGRPSLDGKVDDNFEDIKDNNKRYEEGMICENAIVYSYDRIEDVKKSIVENNEKLALYLLDNDLYDLCYICFGLKDHSDCKPITISYRDLYKTLSIDKDYLGDLPFLIEDHIDITDPDSKLSPIVLNDLYVPDEEVEEVISKELIDYNIPDTSNTDDKFKV